MGSQWWTQIVHLADTLQERATWHVPCEPSSNHFVFQVWRIVYLEPLERIFFFFNRPFRSVRAQWNRCHSKKSWQSTLLFLDLRRKSFGEFWGNWRRKRGEKWPIFWPIISPFMVIMMIVVIIIPVVSVGWLFRLLERPSCCAFHGTLKAQRERGGQPLQPLRGG